MTTYYLSPKINRTDADTLVVHCGDHRFQAGFYEFLNLGLDLNENYDVLVIPGNPQCLTLVEYPPKFSWASWKRPRFRLEKRAPKRIILIARQNCRWYKSLPAFLHRSPDARNRQEEDFQKVCRALTRDSPEPGVELYYASRDANDHVTIEAVYP